MVVRKDKEEGGRMKDEVKTQKDKRLAGF